MCVVCVCGAHSTAYFLTNISTMRLYVWYGGKINDFVRLYNFNRARLWARHYNEQAKRNGINDEKKHTQQIPIRLMWPPLRSKPSTTAISIYIFCLSLSFTVDFFSTLSFFLQVFTTIWAIKFEFYHNQDFYKF